MIFKSPVYRDFANILSGRVISVLAGIVQSVVLARFLDVEVRGTLALMLASCSFLALIASFGIPEALIGHVNRYRENSRLFVYVTSLSLVLFLTPALVAVPYIFQDFVALADLRRIDFTVATGVSCAYVVTTFIRMYLLSSALFVRFNLSSVIESLLFSAFVIFYSYYLEHQYTEDLLILFGVASLISGLSVYNLFQPKKYNKTHIQISELFNVSKDFYLTGILSFLSSRFPIFVLATFSTADELAFFVVANTIPNLVVGAYTHIGAVLYTRISSKNKDYKIATLKKILVKLIALSIIASLTMALFSKEIMTLIFGLNYVSASSYFQVLIFVSLFSGGLQLAYNILSGKGHQSIMRKCSVAALLFLILAYAAMSAHFLSSALVYSLLLSQLLTAIYLIILIKRERIV